MQAKAKDREPLVIKASEYLTVYLVKCETEILYLYIDFIQEKKYGYGWLSLKT